MGFLDDRFGLSGKAALVTGAARGIGRACAQALAGAGAGVGCADLDGEGAKALAKEIEASGGRAVGVEMDCGDEASIASAVEEAASWLGRLDVVVNNAGIFPAMTLEQLDAETFDQVLRVNLRGTFLCMRESVKHVRAAGGGSIVNIASVDGLHPSFLGLGAYGSSKGGVIQLTRNAALEFAADGVTVNAVCPGPIRTEGTQMIFDAGLEDMVLQRIPLKRVGTPEDVAGVVLALSGGATRFVTGAVVVVDGGYLLS